MKINPKIILLTGASAGIGLAVSELLMWQGHKVYAASRRLVADRQDIKSGGCICGVCMDVTNEESIRKAVNTILSKESHLDAVICNAGNGIAGAIEDTSDEEARFQMETNFFGAVNTIRVCLPIFRQQKYGRIIATDSVAGIVPIPFQAFYSASKAALLIYMQALAMEVKEFGIECGCVLPGDTKTDFTASRCFTKASQLDSSCYKDKMKKAVGIMEHDEQNGMSPAQIADAVSCQINGSSVKPILVPGLSYKFICWLMGIIPASLRISIIRKIYS
ncbi:MAG TPA: SDR family oxidoreductase [Candidatus Enterocola sp.]|jgi:NAD(P)-dependent dehydrogenase (short-subunit alcohol dehydrogenase family)|nr:SDR family oxidoreductase [Candidatus Enterocola sp.]